MVMYIYKTRAHQARRSMTSSPAEALILPIFAILPPAIRTSPLTRGGEPSAIKACGSKWSAPGRSRKAED